jgi:hypothetical protein
MIGVGTAVIELTLMMKPMIRSCLVGHRAEQAVRVDHEFSCGTPIEVGIPLWCLLQSFPQMPVPPWFSFA